MLLDTFVASWNRSQSIVTPALLRVSDACADAMPRPTHDLLSSVKPLLPRTTAYGVLNGPAEMYERAFPAVAAKAAKATCSTARSKEARYASFHQGLLVGPPNSSENPHRLPQPPFTKPRRTRTASASTYAAAAFMNRPLIPAFL